jgi:hypothetical protein
VYKYLVYVIVICHSQPERMENFYSRKNVLFLYMSLHFVRNKHSGCISTKESIQECWEKDATNVSKIVLGIISTAKLELKL